MLTCRLPTCRVQEIMEDCTPAAAALLALLIVIRMPGETSIAREPDHPSADDYGYWQQLRQRDGLPTLVAEAQQQQRKQQQQRQRQQQTQQQQTRKSSSRPQQKASQKRREREAAPDEVGTASMERDAAFRSKAPTPTPPPRKAQPAPQHPTIPTPAPTKPAPTNPAPAAPTAPTTPAPSAPDGLCASPEEDRTSFRGARFVGEAQHSSGRHARPADVLRSSEPVARPAGPLLIRPPPPPPPPPPLPPPPPPQAPVPATTHQSVTLSSVDARGSAPLKITLTPRELPLRRQPHWPAGGTAELLSIGTTAASRGQPDAGHVPGAAERSGAAGAAGGGATLSLRLLPKALVVRRRVVQ